MTGAGDAPSAYRRADRRWATLAASVLAALSAGLGYSWSVLLKPLATDFHWSPADVSLTFSAFMTTGAPRRATLPSPPAWQRSPSAMEGSSP